MQLFRCDRLPARVPLRSGLLCGLILCVASGPIHGQEDPFGSEDPFGGDGFAAQPMARGESTPFDFADPGSDSVDRAAPVPAADAKADPLGRNLDPLIFILRERPPQTPRDFGKAIDWMTQLGYWSEVANLLDRVATRNWSVVQQAELARAAGSQTWSRLRREEVPLSQSQKELVQSIGQAPAQMARDERIIDGWIDQLADSQAGQRRMAQYRLLDGGTAAIGRLLERLLGGERQVPADMLAGTIVEFGAEGIEALQAACCLADAEIRGRVLLAVAELPSNHFAVELAAALGGLSTDAVLQQALSDRLSTRFRTLPGEAAIAAHLRKVFDDALARYQDLRVQPDPLPVTVWRPAADGQGLVAQPDSPALQALERLSQLAWMRAQLVAAESQDRIAASAALLQRAYHLNPRLTADSGAPPLAWLPADQMLEADYWIGVFRQAGQWEMHGAALRSVQLFAQQLRAGQSEPPMEFLGELLRDPRRVIRYTALQTIAALDPHFSYAEAEQALATAIEMSRLGRGPLSLVIGARIDLCMAADGLLRQQTGGESVVATSGREALRALSLTHPAEMVLVVDRVHDMSLFELLQRLRNTQGGGSVPVAVLTDELYPYESRYIAQTPGMDASLLSREPEHLKLVIDRLLAALDTSPMTADDRLQFASVGAEFLSRIATDRERYAFYPLQDWQAALIQTQPSQAVAAETQVVAALGTGDSQRRLTLLAAALEIGEPQRWAAVSAFEKSARSYGIRLSDQQVLETYELYNRLGPDDLAIAKALGSILDVIEARTAAR